MNNFSLSGGHGRIIYLECTRCTYNTHNAYSFNFRGAIYVRSYYVCMEKNLNYLYIEQHVPNCDIQY